MVNASINATNYSLPLNNTITNDMFSTVKDGLAWIYSSINDWILKMAAGVIPNASPAMLYEISVIAGLILILVGFRTFKNWAETILIVVIVLLFFHVVLMMARWL